MKKKVIILLLIISMLSACSKTVKTRQEAKLLAEDFFACLKDADKFTMSTYYEGNLASTFSKDGNKMYINYIDTYDYYAFIEDGKQYIINSNKEKIEDKATYAMAEETVESMLNMNIFWYLDFDEVSSFSAVKNNRKLVISFNGQYEDDTYGMTITSKKERGRITDILIETQYNNDYSNPIEYKFEYDTSVDLPEYVIPKINDDFQYIESPYRIYKEVIETLNEDDLLSHSLSNNNLLVTNIKDENYYLFISSVTNDIVQKYNDLDLSDEDYQQKVKELIAGIKIEKCVDFTDDVLTQETMDKYIGKKIQDLLNEGFVTSYYSHFNGNWDIFLTKNNVTYIVNSIPYEDFEVSKYVGFNELKEFEIKDMKFSSVEYSFQ